MSFRVSGAFGLRWRQLLSDSYDRLGGMLTPLRKHVDAWDGWSVGFVVSAT